MKKFAIASIIALAATAASALEVGITSATDRSGATARQGVGATIGTQVGAVGVTGGFERFTKGANDQDRFSVTAGYDIAKFGPVTVTPKVAVAYLNNQTSADGYALAVGVGATVPLNKAIDFTLDASRQYGQKRVQDSDGNAVVAGLKYKF
jgi:outer membrane autotransporter protein